MAATTTPETPTVPNQQTPMKPLSQTPVRPIPQTPTRPALQTPTGSRTHTQPLPASTENLLRSLTRILQPPSQTPTRPHPQTPTISRPQIQSPAASSEILSKSLAKLLKFLESHQTTSTRLINAYTVASNQVVLQEEHYNRCHSALVHQLEIYMRIMQQTADREQYDVQERLVAESQERLDQSVKGLQGATHHLWSLESTLAANLDQTSYTISTNMTNVWRETAGNLIERDQTVLHSAIMRAQQNLQGLGLMSRSEDDGLSPSTKAWVKGLKL